MEVLWNDGYPKIAIKLYEILIFFVVRPIEFTRPMH
jgi:hypothetical protein